MEKCSVRDAALKLTDWFSVQTENAPTRTKPPEAGKRIGEIALVNKPLSFQLKGVDPTHPYLPERGISPETAETFGVGYFAGRGSMHGRIVIPIHNGAGDLVAYAGRAIDESEPKYKLPAGFHKSVELFNLHRAIGQNDDRGRVVVVEGFFDCLKVHQAGFPAVALMGCSLSENQEELLARHFKAVCLLLDGDEAGRNATDEILLRLGKRMWTRAWMLPDGLQPDQLDVERIAQILGA